jgi:hypothetical protein
MRLHSLNFKIINNLAQLLLYQCSNPTPDGPVETPSGDPPVTWGRYDGGQRESLDLKTLFITNETQVVLDHYRQADYAFWTNHLLYLTSLENLIPDDTPRAPEAPAIVETLRRRAAFMSM